MADLVMFFHDPFSTCLDKDNNCVLRSRHNDNMLNDDGYTAKLMFEGQKVRKTMDKYLTSDNVVGYKFVVVRNKQGFERLGRITKTTQMKPRGDMPPLAMFDIRWVRNRAIFCRAPAKIDGKYRQFNNKEQLMEHLEIKPLTGMNSGIIPCMWMEDEEVAPVQA